MSANHTLQTSAATALVELLPTPLPMTASPAVAPVPFGAAAEAVSANFVGSVSADIALALVDTSSVLPAGGSGLVTTANVLRPALENATAALGSGVLGECRTEDASALFSDPDTVVFELRYMETVAGWFGIRVRENGVLGGSGVPSATGQAQDQHGSMAGKLGRINNVEMALTVEIGRTRMSVRDVLNLEPGGVVELDRSAGAPADVLLNGRVIAHGEVVVVDQDYAVRITRILDIADGVH